MTIRPRDYFAPGEFEGSGENASDYFTRGELDDGTPAESGTQLEKLSIEPQKDGSHIVTHHFKDSVSESRITRHPRKRVRFNKGDHYGMLAHLANKLRIPTPNERKL